MRTRRRRPRRPAFVLGLAAGLTIATLAATAPAARAADSHGVPLPRGSRVVSDDADRFTSSRTFRRTLDFYRRFLKRTGAAHEEIPVYRYRGIVVARFLSRDAASPWLAIHVYKKRGRTTIYVVPRPPAEQTLTSEEPRGKE